MMKKSLILFPTFFAFASTFFTSTSKNPFNLIGWGFYLAVIVFLVIKQIDDVLWKVLPIVVSWLLFVGSKLIFLSVQVLFTDVYKLSNPDFRFFEISFGEYYGFFVWCLALILITLLFAIKKKRQSILQKE